MSLNVAVLRQSFDIVVERSPNLTHRFYQILFARYPQAEPLFGRNARQVQEEMLTRALVAVMDHIEDASWLKETLGALGDKHVAYGVTNEMYGWVGDALLATLAEVAGDAWTPEVATAWTDAYGAIAGLVIAGSGAHAAPSRSAAAAAPA
ncbi:MAG: globin domain-containing protein [Minicystis sp.]